MSQANDHWSMTRAPTIDDSSAHHTDDVAAIRRVIADVERAFNTKDPELGTEHFAENGTAVNVFGTKLSGRDALLENGRRVLRGPLRDEYARYEVDDIVFIRPDVAVAHTKAWATTSNGQALGVNHAMVALYVLVKEDGRWWILARQNTLVPDQPPT